MILNGDTIVSSQPPYPAFQAQAPPPFVPPVARPFSVAAVIAIISAVFVPCAGVHVVVSLICSIVALVSTSGGKARGRGLAITSMIVAPALGGLEAAGLLWMVNRIVQMKAPAEAVVELFKSSSDQLPAEAGGLYDRWLSAEFKQQVAPERFKEWCQRAAEKHGRLVEGDVNDARQPRRRGSGPRLEFTVDIPVKFVNGASTVTVDVGSTVEGFFASGMLIDDILIDGASARSAGASTTNAPAGG